MKKVLLNTVYKIFIAITFPIAMLEILIKNMFYGLQLFWWDLLKEISFTYESIKWGLYRDKRKQEERLKNIRENK